MNATKAQLREKIEELEREVQMWLSDLREEEKESSRLRFELEKLQHKETKLLHEITKLKTSIRALEICNDLRQREPPQQPPIAESRPSIMRLPYNSVTFITGEELERLKIHLQILKYYDVYIPDELANFFSKVKSGEIPTIDLTDVRLPM